MTLNYSISDGSPITPLAPHVQPPFYVAIIVAQAIGSTGFVQVVEIPINATDISGYAIFEYGRLVRAVFINNAAYLPGGETRNTTHIDLHFSGSGLPAPAMEVKKLNITYDGICSHFTVLMPPAVMQTRPPRSHGEDKRMKQQTPGLAEHFK